MEKTELPLKYIRDLEHYNEVLSQCASVRSTLWIGTADIKDLYVKSGINTAPFLEVIATLLRRGVAVRIIHAKKPGAKFMEDFGKYPILKSVEMMLCPRVHFKIISFDNTKVYFGSANLTGAGIGMKSITNRNFEAGILTDDTELVAQAVEHFDSVWRGSHCKKCGRRKFCERPIL